MFGLSQITGDLMTVLFVCTGNTCRSPMAAAMFKALCVERGLAEIRVDSAGIAGGNMPVNKHAGEALAKHRVELLAAGSAALTSALVAAADLIVVMTHGHRVYVETEFPSARGKVETLMGVLGSEADVPDPIGREQLAYEECLALMRPALERLVEKCRQVAPGSGGPQG
jgi:protein-tyrosine-phosphatase